MTGAFRSGWWWTVRARLAGLSLMVVCLVALGCASTGTSKDSEGGGEEPRREVRITAVNNLTVRTPTEIRLVSVDGSSRFLGSVGPSGERTFVLEHLSPSGAYILVAETGQGREITSRRFRVFNDAWIRWTMRQNNISIGYRYDRAGGGDSARAVGDTSSREEGE